MEKAAADYVTKSLASLSTTTMTAAPSIAKDFPEKVEKTVDEENILLNKNVNWKQVACLADSLIEGLSNDVTANSNAVKSNTYV